MSTITLTGPDTSPGLSAHVARPSGAGPWPGVVVIHEAWGLDDVMRRQADHLASLGYLAVAPDLFADGGGVRCIRGVMGAMRSGRGRAYADIEAARRWLLDSPDCTGAVGVIGFCMGGGFALMLAGRGEYAAAAPNYGMLPEDREALRGACPIVASYGRRDRMLRGAAPELAGILDEFDVPHDVHEYADAGHSFLNDRPAGPVPGPLQKVMGMGPQPEAAAHAWGRIDAFFREHLAAPAAGPDPATADPS